MKPFTPCRRPRRMSGRNRGWCAGLSLAALIIFVITAGQSWVWADLPPFEVRGSLKQVFVIGAPAGATVQLRDAVGATIKAGVADALGGFVFRSLRPGDRYTVAITAGGQTVVSNPVAVFDESYTPPSSLYTSQMLPVGLYGQAGYGYITTRDGTKLSVQVQIPRGAGPFPTLVEYSGYSPSDPRPDNLGTGQVQPFRLIAYLLDYAYVGVNIRGTGCSGGSFDYFEILQSLDGYDVIEAVAAQPWVKDGRVGMVGISYPGISQLFVAQTRPPHLAAITPLSVIDDTFRSTLYPGGIYNDGFARHWALERIEQNRWPDPVGANWVVDKVRRGDMQCTYNQLLRQQNPDLLEKIQMNPFYPGVDNTDYPDGGDFLAPYTFVNRINVPTFIAGAWQDEQTGGHWPVMLDQFASGTPLRIEATNGTHSDSLGPSILFALIEFLDIHVARRVPAVPDSARFIAQLLYGQVFGAANVRLPANRFRGLSYEAARALYDAENGVHVLWENGARPDTPVLGAPEPTAESVYSQWPPRETVLTYWYLQPDGKLSRTTPGVSDDEPRGASIYQYDPSAKPRGNFHCPDTGGDPNSCNETIWKANAVYDWRVLPDGRALSFLSDPLPDTVTMLGSGSVDLWIQSTAADTDIEVTLTEVRPDGQERYIQNGWLRASHRRLDTARSTELRPRHTHLERDAAPLPPGQFVPIRVELFPFAHVFRAGSRIRLSVEAPGGNRPLWTFNVLPASQPVYNWIAHSVGRPSRIVLPVVPAVAVPAAYPPCPTSLRSQPCRAYVASGAPTEVAVQVSGTDVQVSWKAATAPPNRAITGYTVTAYPSGAQQSVSADAVSAIFRQLAPDIYSFSVVTNYDAGRSPSSSPSLLTPVGRTNRSDQDPARRSRMRERVLY